MKSRFLRLSAVLILLGLLAVLTHQRTSDSSTTKPQRGASAREQDSAAPPPLIGKSDKAPQKTEAEPAKDFGAWASEKIPTPDLAKIEAFQGWMERWKKATPEERAAMVEEGKWLAKERRGEFKVLIASNPRAALEQSIPRVIRQDLPEEIVASLEKPVSATGNYQVYMGRPAPGMPMPEEGLTLRYFETADGMSYQARVFGEMEPVMSRKQIPLRGVAIDRELAVAESPVRQLEIGERIAAGTVVEDVCPVSGITTEAVASNEPVTEEAPTVEVGERLITLCNGSHVTVMDEKYRTFVQASGPGGAGFYLDNFPGTSSRAIGNFRCLYIRVTYPDQMTPPNTEDQALNDMKDVARYYRETSFGKLTVTSTVTPLITLPQTLAWYIAKDAEVDGLGVIHNQARAEARKLGYDSSQYNCIIVRVNGGLRSGASWGGGDSVWAGWGGMDVLNHECGHSLGLNHANYWNTTDGTAYGTGANQEYGNPYDVMGGSGGFSAHYNTISKRALNWLPANYFHSPATNGVYRIHAYDQPTLEEGKRYALNVAKDSVRQYNVEYHPARGGLLEDSALVLYSGMGSNAGHLLDTTPGSAGGKNDAGIAVGRTFSDLEADMHFTVLSKNNTTPPSLDVAYFKGPFPGNSAPTATFAASATTINAGESVTFTATASDSNGDALAYHWEFSDGVAGDGSSTFSRVFVLPSQVTAMLTVSDMKGGTVRRSMVINVGAHGKQTVSGTVTFNGQPLPGVYISGSGLGCYTNSDGTYSLAGQPTGSVTLAASLNGYTFTPSVANPMTVVAGTNTANWTATGSTFVTLANVADPVEGGASGTFRLTRTGDTTNALTVLVSPVGGTATRTTDYSFSTGYTASGSFFSFTIPAGASTLDITVAPVNDTTAEGPETITLQLASAAGYLSGSGNAVVMTIGDNDTSLPQVGVTAPDPYAVEGGSDTGTFTFTRTGSTAAALSLTVAWTGTATNGTDFTTLPTTVTFPANAASTTLTVSPLNDAAAEVPETIIATISANNSVYLRNSAATTSTVTLTDDDTPQVTVSVPDSSASENGPDSGVFLLTRSGPTTSALKVYYGLSGTALHGTDYAMLNGEVTIPAGASSAPVVILPNDDDIAEASENVTLAVTTFDNAYSVGAAYQATVTINDNADQPLVAVRAGTAGVEGSTNATLIFRAIGNSAGNVTVNYAVSGTATAGSDYTALSGSVSIPANGTNDVTVTVPVTDDSSFEPAETVKVTIIPSVNYRVYNDGTAEAVIRDNEGGTERVSVSAYNDSPAEASSVQGRFYLSRTGTVGALTVNYALSGTATTATDYTGLSGTAVIPDGQSGVNVTLVPLDDSTVEGSESVTVTVSSGTGYSPDRPSSATLFIADNETSTVTVGFQALASANGEAPGALGEYRDIPVVLSAASASTISVSYTGGGGTAMGDDVDWAFADASAGNAAIPGGTLTFAPGVTTQNIRVRIKNDLVREPNELAVLRLVNPAGASFTTSRSQHNLFIYDEIPAGLVTEERWNATNVYTNNTWDTVGPDYTGFLTSFTPDQNAANVFSRRLTGLITAPTTGAYIFWIASDDASRLFVSTDATAANKVQRASLGSATTFQNWTANSSQQSISLNLTAGQSYYVEVQHQETGGSDHVSVAWQGPGFSRTPILTPVPDNAPRYVRFAVDSSTCLETDASAPMLMAVLDRPAGATPVTVNYTTSGTASSGTDYTLAPGTLTFNSGEQFKLLPLTFVADSVGEAPESLIVALSSPVGATISSPATHLITLIDPGTPVVNTVFASATSSQSVGSVIATSTATVVSPRVVSSWSIIAGNPNNAFAINSAGQVTLAFPGSLPNPGNVQLVVRATNDLGSSGDGAVNIVCNPPSGQAVAEQRWSGTTAYNDEDWSGTPIYSGTLPSLTSAQGVGDNFSRRLVGYLKPTVSGTYYFWTASDDQSRLYLGSNGYESSKTLIATVNDWTAFQGWDEESNQISSGISLVAGQTYWIEAQQVEGGGGDHVSVAWQGPGIARQAIPSTVMGPFVAGAASGDPTPQAALPSVAITSPTNNATYFSTNNISITASVTPNGQTVTGVEFYRDNVLIGTDAVAPYEATYANATTAASVNLTARALYLNTYVTSPSVNISVQDSNPPVVATRYFAANSGMSVNTVLGSATATLSAPRTLSSWAIVAGNTGSLFSINSTSGQISLQQPSSLPAPGMIFLTVRATDSAGYSGDGTIGIFCNSTGSSVWINPSGGSWPTVGNWSNNTAVSGASSIADFSVLNLTANAAVTLDGARTVGTLVFGDTTPSHNWTLSTGSAGPLTLNTTTGNPVVTVNNQTATLNLVVAGTKGLIKNGAGTLALGGINTFTGGLTVNAGTVSLQPGDYNSALPTNSAVTINNGGTVIQVNTNVTNNGVAFTVNAGGTLNFASYHAHLAGITLNGGTLLGTGSGKYAGEDFLLNGNVTVGGTTASSISVANGIGFASRTFTVADATTSPAADLTISGNGAIKGTGTLTKAGVGTMAVANSNTYSGGTTINAGTLLATNSAGSATGSGAVSVAASGTLGGNGTVSGAVSISGGLAPGVNGVGTLTLGSTLNLAGTSTSTLQLAKTGAVLSNDRVQGITTLTLGGTLTVSASGDALAAGDTFDVFDATSFSGSFATVNLPTLPSGLLWNTSQLSTAGIIVVENGVLPQTITFGALATKTFGDASFALGATASSGLTVSYSSSNPSVATVSGNTVTIVGAGSTTLTASQAGNAGYLAATPVDQVLTVNKAAQSITFGSITTRTFGGAPFSLGGSASSGLPVGYLSSNPAVATISGSTVTIVGAGTATITASQAGDGNFQPATSVPQTLTVNKASQVITFGTLASKTFGDATFNLGATANSGLTVSYLSSNPAVATISGTTVTIVGSGSTTITASQSGNGNYLAATSVPQSLTVGKASQVITFGSLASKSFGDAAFNLGATSTSGLSVAYLSSNPAVATISGNTVTIVGAGTTTITASQAGDTNYQAATSVPQTLTVGKASQVITFGSLASKSFGDAAFNLGATSTSGLSVAYLSSNPAVATISGNTVTIIGSGSTTITASQAGNTNYEAASSVPQTLTVGKASQEITFGSLASKSFGDAAFNLGATSTSGLSVAYLSSNPAVATISGNTVTIIGAGSTTITASQAGNTNYEAASSVPQTLTVGKASQEITFGALASKSYGDPTFNLGGTSTSGLSVAYLSSNPAVATISGNTVTIVGAGSTTITASQAGDTNYLPAISVPQTLTVDKASQVVTFGAIAAKTYGDASFTLGATSTSGLAVGYESSNASVATVSGNTVTIVGAGTATITASQAGDTNYQAATSVPQTLTVGKASQVITFDSLASKTFGDPTFNLGATSSSALSVSYLSSNPAVATISGNTVTIVGAGSTTITASQSGDANYQAATSVPQTLTVGKASQEITFGALTSKSYGDAAFNLGATSNSGLSVTYESADPSVATISGNTLTIVGAGTTTITASQSGDINYEAATSVPQTLMVGKASQVITFGALTSKTYGDSTFDLGATSTSSLSIAYLSSNPAVATISGNTVTIVGAGTTTITASQAGDSNYLAATSIPQTLTVGKASQAITFGALTSKTCGDASFALGATSNSGLSLSYESSNPLVATVSGNTVTIVGAGTTTITASQAGDTNYLAATSVPQTLTVDKASQEITFGALTSKSYGDVAFNLGATSNSGLSVTYESADSSVATISGNTVTIVGAGTTTITASQAGDSNYLAATSVPQTLTVGKASQAITFGALTSKTYGDASFALGATSNSGLSLSYESSNPLVATVAGNTVTIVGAGTTTITASQAGDINYEAATSVLQTLTVDKSSQAITFGALTSKTYGDASFALGATSSSGLSLSYESSNASVATVSGNTVTIVGAGTTTITASQAGDANYLAATSVPQTLTIGQASQVITFDALPAKTYGDAAFSLNATSDAGLPISYSSSNNSIASVSGNLVTIVGAGSVSISASQAGGGNHLSATDVVRSLTIAKASAAVGIRGLAQTYDGSSKPVTTSTTPSGLAVSVTYNGSAEVPIAAGSYAVVATIEDPNHAGSNTATLVISSSLEVSGSHTLVLPDSTATYQSLLNDGTLVFGAGSLHITGNATNNGVIRLTGNAVFDVSGTFTNAGVIDIINWSGTLPPGIAGSGTVLDRSAIKVTSTQASSTQFSLSVPSYAGHLYQLESKADLSGPWVPLGAPIPGTGGALNPPAMQFAPTIDGPRRFYRVVVSPAP